MKITALTVGKKSIVTFVIFFALSVLGCFYLIQPVDVLANYFPQFVDSAGRDIKTAVYSPESPVPDSSVSQNSDYPLTESVSDSNISKVNIGSGADFSSATTAGAAYIFECCFEEACGAR